MWDELNQLQYFGIDLTTLFSRDWFVVDEVKDATAVIQLQEQLDAGESEAIILAKGLGADVLLIDEAKGRKIAQTLGLDVIGVLGILLKAKEKRLIAAIKPYLDELQQMGFRISPALLTKILSTAQE